MKHPSGVAVVLLCLSPPLTAWACGSMGLDQPRVLGTLAAAVFAPMVALIPVEIWLLHRLGGLGRRVLWAYLACLPAKAAGLYAVFAAAQADLVETVVVAELFYSAGHLLISGLVLLLFFGLRGRPLALTSLSISTLIPWLYSAGFWTILATLEGPLGVDFI